MGAFVCVRAHVHTPLALQCEWIAKDHQLLKESLRHERQGTNHNPISITCYKNALCFPIEQRFLKNTSGDSKDMIFNIQHLVL